MSVNSFSFTLIRNYKVLKQSCITNTFHICFTLIRNYKVLKQELGYDVEFNGFTLIRNYKVLKRESHHTSPYVRFTLIRNYKVLKQVPLMSVTSFMFYTYSKLQGSQTNDEQFLEVVQVLHLFETTRFSNSNCHHRTYILGCIIVSKYYFTIKHLSLSIIKILLSPKSFLSSDSINNIETFL